MSTPGTSGSHAAGAFESTKTYRRVTRARLAAAATPQSDSAQAGTEGTEEAIEIDDDVPAGSKRGQKGPKLKYEVWKEFTRMEINRAWKAKCHWCKKYLGGDTRNGTNHLRGHLDIYPDRSVRKGLKQSSLKLTANPKDGTVSLEKYTFDQEVARKKLPLMIIVHEYPLSMLDHAGFRKFCAALQPLFKVVSRNTIRKDILDMYEVQRQSMVQYFRRLSSRVAVTTDLWTANHQRKGYMAVTAHFLDDEWKLKSFLLRFIYVPAPHTVEVITDVLHEVLLDWHIERNLSIITLDNCSTNDNLMKNMVGTNNDQLMKSMAAMEEYQDSMEGVATTDGAQPRTSSAPSRIDDDDEDWIGTFDDYMSKQPTVTSTYVRIELDLYLEEPLLPRTQDLDFIDRWQYAGLKYPTLRRIARDVLPIPVTTVASESMFSTGGRLISPHRSRLTPSMVEALMCMQAWSRADMLGPNSTFVDALMTCLDEEDEDMDDPTSTIVD